MSVLGTVMAMGVEIMTENCPSKRGLFTSLKILLQLDLMGADRNFSAGEVLYIVHSRLVRRLIIDIISLLLCF